MVSSGAPLPPSAGSARLAEARERFLTAESVAPGLVRGPILASWWRSRDWQVAADRVELSYIRDPNLDTPLTRSAMPVLRNLYEHLDGQPISIILTDSAGVVLSRMTADRDLERELDGVQLAPGFSYAEEQVGTNGIGTALEGGQPAHVFGHEHYAEDLEVFGCAGVLMAEQDRKSTRLNSSHSQISYAVFCLKKKKIKTNTSKNTMQPSNINHTR